MNELPLVFFVFFSDLCGPVFLNFPLLSGDRIE